MGIEKKMDFTVTKRIKASQHTNQESHLQWCL